MITFRPVLSIIGILVAALGVAMLVPAMVDLAADNENWWNFIFCGFSISFIGLCTWLATLERDVRLSLRQAFVLTVMAWISLAVAGAMPIYLSIDAISFTDSFFEAMSGITTTGATVLTGLDDAPPGLLLWRAILQWLGGLGIIVMAVAVLPMLGVGGMQLFKVEAFETPDKILPRATQISGSLTLLFILFTLLCMISYTLAGMGALDATIHAMTTVATGGFSSKDGSIGHFDSVSIDLICMVFMCVGSLPFLTYLRVFQGRLRDLIADSQVRSFFLLLSLFILFLLIYQRSTGSDDGFQVLRNTAFNVISIMTGTGYATADYAAWGPFAVGLFLIMMFVGGCAGSTSCGIKIFRFEVLAIEVRHQLRLQMNPNGVFVRKYNGHAMPDGVSSAVMSFLFVYLASVGLLALLLSLTGLDAMTALSGAATAISNVGPGLGGTIGPTGTFQSLSDPAKWMLSFGMLLGRLELFTLLVLLSPFFWRR